jgi:hypothetical protein
LEHVPDDWRLFIDASANTLKAVLLNNNGEYPSVPVFFSEDLREKYEVISLVINLICYEKYKWLICGDLKIITIMLGQQQGYTKYPCFLCEWDSRDDDNHWNEKNWPLRSDWTIGNKNVKSPSLVDSSKILLPPLHIKLGLMKQFTKQLCKDENSRGFKYLKSTFLKLSVEKIRNGVFVGPQIKKLFADPEFEFHLEPVEKMHGLHLKWCQNNFWAITKVQFINS